jgi:hypothetical protein
MYLGYCITSGIYCTVQGKQVIVILFMLVYRSLWPLAYTYTHVGFLCIFILYIFPVVTLAIINRIVRIFRVYLFNKTLHR